METVTRSTEGGAMASATEENLRAKKIYQKHPPLVHDGRHYRHKTTNVNGTT